MKEKLITIDGQQYTIKKLALGKYVQLIKALKGSKVISRLLEEDLSNFKELGMAKLAELLPDLMGEAWPDVLKLISIASGINEQKLNDEIGLDEGLEILAAILEVNDFEVVKKNIGRLIPKDMFKNLNQEYQTLASNQVTPPLMAGSLTA